MPYLLTPPTLKDAASHDDRDSIWSRVRVDRGRCLRIHTDGTVTVTDVAYADDTVLRYWPGGRTYTISDEDAATLTAAGYASNLTAI